MSVITGRLFYSKYLDLKVKVIAYQSLIRSIITYACQIWYNIPAKKMEELRILERKCLRTCIGFSKSRDHETKKFKNNYTLYNTADIIRIDNHLIKLIRGYFAAASVNTENEIIGKNMTRIEEVYSDIIDNKWMPPEAFIYMDHKGLIQDRNNIPILYHIRRKADDRKITHPWHSSYGDPGLNWAYDIALSDKDQEDDYKRDKEKFWWLEERH